VLNVAEFVVVDVGESVLVVEGKVVFVVLAELLAWLQGGSVFGRILVSQLVVVIYIFQTVLVVRSGMVIIQVQMVLV